MISSPLLATLVIAAATAPATVDAEATAAQHAPPIAAPVAAPATGQPGDATATEVEGGATAPTPAPGPQPAPTTETKGPTPAPPAATMADVTAVRRPRTVAIVVGANAGMPGRKPLRFAYLDAQNMAQALEEVAGFAASDVQVLLDPDPDILLKRLDESIAALKTAGGETLLFFYYSGHADGQALYPAGKPVTLARLRSRLDEPAVTVRLSMIDACRGGGWTGAKGLAATQSFATGVPLELGNEGSVLISSSSGLEDAHESAQLRGSFFTHHWIAALRGAADSDGDGTITLTEAYSYAQELTVRDTTLHADTPQHPSFKVSLRGRQDLPVAQVGAGPSILALGQDRGPLQVVHLMSGLIIAELPEGERRVRLALAPGRYVVRRRIGRATWAHEVDLRPREAVTVEEASLSRVEAEMLASKGFEVDELGPEEPTRLARAELVMGQTLHGLVLGMELCSASDVCGQDVRGQTAALLLSTAAGLTVPLLLTEPGVRPGDAILVNSATLLGVANGYLLQSNHELTSRNTVVSMMIGQAAGLGAGVLAAWLWEPNAGDVSLANSGAIWVSTVTTILYGTFYDSAGTSVSRVAVIAADVGALGGAFASRLFPMSRGRTLILDAGGFLGALAGTGILILATGGDAPKEAWGIATAAGVVTGLGTAAFLTRDWDLPATNLQLAAMPQNGGFAVAVGFSF